MISFVIPVHNKENYVANTIDSILNMNNCEGADYEILLIENASTDGSAEICDEYGRKYENVTTYHLEIGGLSRARNYGVEQAKGEYVVFVDADDYLRKDFYNRVKAVIDEYSPDIIEYGWFYDNNGVLSGNNSHAHPKCEILSKEYIYKKVIPPLINICPKADKFIYDFAWNKVFKKSLIEEYDIRFLEDRAKWEDRPYLVEYLKYAKNIYFIGEGLYYYKNDPDSLSRKFAPDIFKCIVENYEMYHGWFESEFEMNTEYEKNYWGNSVHGQILELFVMMADQKVEERTVKELLLTIIDNPTIISWFEQSGDIPVDCKEAFLKKDAGTLYGVYNTLYLANRKQQLKDEKKYRVKSAIKRLLGR